MTRARRLAVILLAAGESRRYGASDKLLADLAGRPLARHIADRLAGLEPGALIAVCRDDRVAALLAEAGFTIVRNDAPARGLSHSLALGIAATPAGIEAALVCLADMPNVPTTHLRALIAAFDAERAPVVASALADRPMPPAMFGRAHFAALRGLTGDRGARDLLRAAVHVPSSAEALADIDRPADLWRASAVALGLHRTD